MNDDIDDIINTVDGEEDDTKKEKKKKKKKDRDREKSMDVDDSAATAGSDGWVYFLCVTKALSLFLGLQIYLPVKSGAVCPKRTRTV